MGVCYFLASGPVRSRVSPWQHFGALVDHAQVGGVSLTQRLFRFGYTQPVSGHSLEIPTSIPRDISTVLEFSAPCEVFIPSPTCPPLETPTALNLCRSGPPVYYGRGWLPPFPSLATSVLTPNRSAWKGRWGQWHLTRRELLLVYDVGEAFLSPLMDSGYPDPQSLPLHMWTAAITAVCVLCFSTGGILFWVQQGSILSLLPILHPSELGRTLQHQIYPVMKQFQ